MSNEASQRIGLTRREDGLNISTVKPHFMNWHGPYETAVIWDTGIIRIAEGYDTLEEAKAGHEKYVNMPTEELEEFKWIG